MIERNERELINTINANWMRKIEDIRAEIESLYPTYTLSQIRVCDKCIEIIDKHISGKE